MIRILTDEQAAVGQSTALLADLNQRGLPYDILVLFGPEFGRLPTLSRAGWW